MRHEGARAAHSTVGVSPPLAAHTLIKLQRFSNFLTSLFDREFEAQVRCSPGAGLCETQVSKQRSVASLSAGRGLRLSAARSSDVFCVARARRWRCNFRLRLCHGLKPSAYAFKNADSLDSVEPIYAIFVACGPLPSMRSALQCDESISAPKAVSKVMFTQAEISVALSTIQWT